MDEALAALALADVAVKSLLNSYAPSKQSPRVKEKLNSA